MMHPLRHLVLQSRVESVEADARMAAIATKFFGVPVRDGVSVVDVDDASAAASSLAEQLNKAEAPMEHTAGRLQLGLLRGGRQNGETALGKKRWCSRPSYHPGDHRLLCGQGCRS